jgi:sugar-specific transcriptional regulator TrmB
MLSDENATQTLTQLGLTVLEARIYLALCKYGSLTTKELSKLTKTAQTDTYRVANKLLAKGLIEKVISKPAQFKSIPIDASATSLLQKKKAEYNDLKVKTRLLVQAIKDKPVIKPVTTAPSQFALIPQSATVVKKIREAIEKSKERVDIFLSWERFLNGITGAFGESSEKAWGRGVKFRIVVETPQDESGVERALRFCGKSPLCDIRFLPGSPKTVLGIYDGSEVFIILDPEEGLFDSPALWSNNRSLISVVQDYFEILWLTAIEANALSAWKEASI